MEIKIILGKNYGKLENPTETLADEQVILKFESEYVLAHAIVRLSDGKNEKKFDRYNLGDFVLPEEYKKAGVLYIGVDLIAKGEVKKHFDVEPLTFKEVDSELQFVPLIVEQNRKIAELTELVRAQGRLIDALTERIGIVEMQVQDIWEYEEQ